MAAEWPRGDRRFDFVTGGNVNTWLEIPITGITIVG